jgi:hypothetical protein
VIYQIWAFKKNKSKRIKFLPIVAAMFLGLLILVVLPFTGGTTYFMIFPILIVEFSLKGIMLIILFEICSALFGNNKNSKRAVILSIVFIIITVIYYLAEKVI